jgi:hypothetical protein
MELSDSKTYADRWEKESASFEAGQVYAWLSGIAPKENVLEIGVGVGLGTAALAVGRRVLGVDNNEHLASKARERIAATGIDASIVVMDLLAPTPEGVGEIQAFAPTGIAAWLLGGSGDDQMKYLAADVPFEDRAKKYREHLEDAIMSSRICPPSVQWIHFAIRSWRIAEATDALVKQAQKENYDEWVFHPHGFDVVDVQLFEWDRNGSSFTYIDARHASQMEGTRMPTVVSILARRMPGV